jgi:hypothetical protein
LQDVVARAADVLRMVIERHVNETVVLVGHDSINRTCCCSCSSSRCPLTGALHRRLAASTRSMWPASTSSPSASTRPITSMRLTAMKALAPSKTNALKICRQAGGRSDSQPTLARDHRG